MARQIEAEEFAEAQMLLAGSSQQRIDQEVARFRLRPLVEAVHRAQALPRFLQPGMKIQVAFSLEEGGCVAWWDAEIAAAPPPQQQQEQQQQQLTVTYWIDDTTEE
ncbi:hypothetical protein, conserved, partial [Eimeria tenella]